MIWKFLEQQKQTPITLLFKTPITQNKNPNPYQWPLMTYGNWSPATGPHLLLLGGNMASSGATKPLEPLETAPALSFDSYIWGWFVNLLVLQFYHLEKENNSIHFT